LKWIVEKDFFWIELHIDRSLFRDEPKEQQMDEINEEESQASGNNFLKRKEVRLNHRMDELVQDA
jgi:hypothetical protein